MATLSDSPGAVQLAASHDRTPSGPAACGLIVLVRYGRMLASPFAFLRGAAYPMAADLATEGRRRRQRRHAAWIVLLLGRGAAHPLFLQCKEAEASMLEPFLGASAFTNHGQRVVEGQPLIQAASDIMLGWIRAADPDGRTRDLYVRRLWDQHCSARWARR